MYASSLNSASTFVAAATYEYDVEFHSPEVENKDEKTPAQIRQEQVRPDLNRNDDPDFEGYRLSQTLGAVATQSLFGKLVDRDDLPGNREGAASARRAGPAGLYGDHDGSPIQ